MICIAPAAPLLTPQPISSNQPQPPSQLPSNKSSSLPDEWKLKSSPSETEWKRQKELEGARNDAIDAMMKMTGLESIKEQLLRIKSKIDTAQRQNASVKAERFNIVFLGNPGTGQSYIIVAYQSSDLMQGKQLWRDIMQSFWPMLVFFLETPSLKRLVLAY